MRMGFGDSPIGIALAWLLAQKPWIIPIPGSRKLERLDENLGAVSIDLTPDDLRDFAAAVSKLNIQGDRYHQDMKNLAKR